MKENLTYDDIMVIVFVSNIILKIIYTRKLHTIFIDRENSFGKRKHSQLQQTHKLFNF